MTEIATAHVLSAAPPSAFFARWADMATWPDWNLDTEWVRLDGPFVQGATGTLKPQGGPRVPFVVESLIDGREFVDVSRLFGARLTFAHNVTPVGDGVGVDADPGEGAARVARARPGARRGRRAGRLDAGVSPRRLATRHAQASDSPGLVLWQVTNRWQAAQRAALKAFDLTHVQFVLLASLTWLDTDSPVTQRRLAEHAATDPMMTSQVVRALASRGLVLRAPHPDDGRAVALAVTGEGAALANRAVVAVETCDEAFFAALGKGRAGFVAQLRRLL